MALDSRCPGIGRFAHTHSQHHGGFIETGRNGVSNVFTAAELVLDTDTVAS